MKRIGELIRKLREKNALPLRKVAAALDIDQAILSKIERGLRKPSKVQIHKLAKLFDYDEKEMMVLYLSDRIVNLIEDEDYAVDALKVAEEKITYLSAHQLKREAIIKKIREYLKKDARVNKAWIFGSFARGEETAASDIDLMVEFEARQSVSLFDMEEIKYKLENLVNRKIDLVEKGFVKSFAQESVKSELQQVYGKQ